MHFHTAWKSHESLLILLTCNISFKVFETKQSEGFKIRSQLIIFLEPFELIFLPSF